VQLKHLPTGIVIKCQETRSRQQNRDIARRLLADKIEHLQNGEQSRVAIKTREAAKKKASKTKKSQRKYRKLDDAKRGEAGIVKAEDMKQEPASVASDA
jgi:protein subunit release factor B